ncbi:hypothetical protein GCM10020254_21190 [Streptomyces goshikiensis]
METAARAPSSSAKDRSSSSKASGVSARQKFAIPRTTPRAWSGTEISECSPYSRAIRVPSWSWARQPKAPFRSAASTARPASSAAAIGAVGTTNRMTSPTGWSGWSVRIPLIAVRRICVYAPPAAEGSSPCSTGSSSSTVTKSANRGTATSDSSSAVRTTSRVVPMLTPAS